MPLRDVCAVLPDHEGDYWGEWNRWLATIGKEIQFRGLREEPPRGFAIASGYGGRNYPDDHPKAGQEILHAAVVFNGKLIHDPFPGAEAFDRVRYYWTIGDLEEAEKAA